MLDPRTKDAIRQIPITYKQLDERVAKLEHNVEETLKCVRLIKQSIVRKKKKSILKGEKDES